MIRFSLRKITYPLRNEKGVAALMGVVFGIIIVGSIAFNFLAESRQKQAGSILTYTSTNAFMIAEAGMRYAEKCLLIDSTTGDTECDAIQGKDDWATDIDSDENFNDDFGGGNFAINFAGHTDDDEDNIFVVSTGTYKGGQRSIQRFISRQCVLSLDGATSCLGTITNNNSFIDPEPDASATGVCPTNPPGIVVNIDDLIDTDDCFECDGTDPCPDFDAVDHLTGIVLNTFEFCDMKLDGSVIVETAAAGTDTILVAKDFTIKDLASLKLAEDAATGSNTFAVTSADIVDVAGHSYVLNDKVSLSTTGTLPTGLSISSTYYVVTPINANDFKLSLTSSGTAVTIAVDGSGTHSIEKELEVDTKITVHGKVLLKDAGDIRVKGSLTLKVKGTMNMKNSSRINNSDGNVADMLAQVEGDVVIKNSALFVGALQSDGKITFKNNAELQGSVQAQEVKLKNNATLIFEDNSGAGSNTSGYEECTSADLLPGWSE